MAAEIAGARGHSWSGVTLRVGGTVSDGQPPLFPTHRGSRQPSDNVADGWPPFAENSLRSNPRDSGSALPLISGFSTPMLDPAKLPSLLTTLRRCRLRRDMGQQPTLLLDLLARRGRAHKLGSTRILGMYTATLVCLQTPLPTPLPPWLHSGTLPAGLTRLQSALPGLTLRRTSPSFGWFPHAVCKGVDLLLLSHDAVLTHLTLTNRQFPRPQPPRWTARHPLRSTCMS